MAWKQKLAEIFVEITAKLGPLRSAMAKANALIKRGMATMARWAKRGALAIGVALAAALTFATKAAIRQEQAESDLEAALRKTGDATQSNIDKLKEYASELQKITIYGDEEIIAQMAYAKNLGVSADQLEEATKAAMGLAAAYKLDLNTAMMLVGRASQGQTQMLTRYGIVLDEGLSTQEKFNELLRIGASNFSLVEAAANTTRGRLIIFWNKIGDIAEVVGQKLLDKIMPIVEAMGEWVEKNEKLIKQKIDEYYDKIAASGAKAGKALGWLYEKRKPIAAAAAGIGIVWVLDKAYKASLLLWGGLKLAKVSFAALTAGAVATFGHWKGLLNAWKDIRTVTGAGVGFFGKIKAWVIASQNFAKVWWAVKGTLVAAKIAAVAVKAAFAALWLIMIGGAVAVLYHIGALVKELVQWRGNLRKIRDAGKAATKEEIKAYQDKIKASDEYKKKIEEREAARKKAAEEAKLAEENAQKAEEARLKGIQDRIKAKADKEKKAIADAEEARLKYIETLEKQLEMYEELGGYEGQKADIKEKLTVERSKEISKELGIEEWRVYNYLILQSLKEREKLEKKIAKDKEDERKRNYANELESLRNLFTNAKGYKKELAQVERDIRKREAKELAAQTELSEKEALAILDAKAAASTAAKVGFTGLSQAWSQIATGASQTERQQLKETKKSNEYLKDITENTKDLQTTAGGYG